MTQASPPNTRAKDITDDDERWIRQYEAAVVAAFTKDFEAAKSRFKHGPQLIGAFQDSVKLLLNEGRRSIAKVDSLHNELCIAARLLSNAKPGLFFDVLEYEPKVTDTGKSIDFRAVSDNGALVFIDVKTIQPQRNDRWDQFEKVREQKLFPDNVNVVLSKGWLGGELWHGIYAARASTLQYVVEFEEKIRDGKLAGKDSLFVLALCGEGFHWHQDNLEDFVSFYTNGSHRGDDPIAKMESHFMADKGITLDRTINRFCCMNRPQFDIQPRRLNWNVKPPVFQKF